MKYEIFGILAVFFAIGMAGAVEPLELSGKDFSDIDMFNGTDILNQNSDLAGTSAVMMGIDESFIIDNPEDGKPLGPAREPLLLGSMAEFQPDDVYYFTPAELTMIMNSSTKLEIIPGV